MRDWDDGPDESHSMTMEFALLLGAALVVFVLGLSAPVL